MLAKVAGGITAAILLWGVCFTVLAQPLGRGERRAATVFLQHFILRVQDCVVPRPCWALAKKLGVQG